MDVISSSHQNPPPCNYERIQEQGESKPYSYDMRVSGFKRNPLPL